MWRLLRSGNLAELTRRTVTFLGGLGHRPTPVDYTEWRRRWVEVNDATRARIDDLVAALPHRPKFTLLLATGRADRELVAATVNSVVAQRYADWLLCVSGMELTDSEAANPMTALADSRVRFTRPDMVPPEGWVARLAPGDLLHEAALFAMADATVRHPDAAVVYTDHDHIGPDGRFVDPHMKPDWNPDLLAGMDYFGVLTAYRADLWEIHSGVATDPHNLAVTATAHLGTDQVVHVPHVLATLRVSSGESHRLPPTVRVVHRLPDPPPRVSVIIPTRNRGRMLERCLTSLRNRTDYPDLEVVVVDHQSTEARARRVINGLAKNPNTKVLGFSGPFNFAAMINRAANAATGGVLVPLNNDTEVIEPNWLTELVVQVSRPEVGIAGALLVFGDGTIQHAGVHPGVNGLMGHGHKHLHGDDPGYFGRLLVPHEVAAVTGACLAVEAATWKELGGFDEEHLPVAYNDIDLCLKARQAGLRVVFTPHSRLVHHESVSRGVDAHPTSSKRLSREVEVMRERWGELLNYDPAYSPSLVLTGPDFTLAKQPRSKPPWGNRCLP